MKKLLVILAVLIIVCASGCSKTESDSAKTETVYVERQDGGVTWWDRGEEPEDHYEDMEEYYEDEVRDAVTQATYEVREEYKDLEIKYQNALDVIGYYVGKYGEYEGYDEDDFVTGDHEVDYRSGEEDIIPYLGGD